MERPTVHDIARHANVSLATVDRVLNGRPGVRAKTVERVQHAIRELGYRRDVHAANLARKKLYNFTFVLPETRTQFIQSIIDAVGETAGTGIAERCQLSIIRVPTQDPHAVSQILAGFDPGQVDGLAILAPETPRIRDAVVRLRDHGVSVVPIVSDLPTADCGHFVGINNIAAGRTAAYLLGRFCGRIAGKVGVIAGTMNARDHLERRLGFDQVMDEQFAHLDVLPTRETWDRAESVEMHVRDLLTRHGDLVGIYAIGAGNAGLVTALENLRPENAPVIIAHELTEISRRALVSGTFAAVISQDSGHIVRSAVRVLRAQTDDIPISLAQERIRIDIFTRENLPEFPENRSEGGTT